MSLSDPALVSTRLLLVDWLRRQEDVNSGRKTSALITV